MREADSLKERNIYEIHLSMKYLRLLEHGAYTVNLLKASVGKVVYIMAYMQTSYCKIQHK